MKGTPVRHPRLRRVLTAATAVLTLALAAGCGSDDEPAGSTDPNAVLKVGASPVPHAEILNYIKANLAEGEGLNLEVVEFTDYIQPNVALQDKQIDANYFQTVPYLDEQKRSRGYDFTPLEAVHLEPLGLYSRKFDDLAAVPDGAQVGIPNDPTNAGRSLRLLADKGLITLKDTGQNAPTALDVDQNSKQLKITEIEAAQLPRSLQDLDLAVINGNYALEGGLTPAKDALELESAENNPNANLLVVRTGDQDDPRVQKLEKLLHSPEVKKFIEDKYQGAVIPTF
jgi:D-methionine transport system substrate-binding protein